MNISEDNERELIDRAQAGEAIAFERLAKLHVARLWRCALTLCRDGHWAEDLAQETLVEAWRSVARFDGRCKFSTWLYGVLRHRFLKGRRQQDAARPDAPDALGPDSVGHVPSNLPTPSSFAEASEDTRRIRQAVASLPEAHRLVIELRFFAGATLDEIAAALGCPLGTVKSRLHHALGKLRQMNLEVNLFTSTGESRQTMNDLHHNCERWAERISLLAAGCLTTDEEQDVRRHIETCPDCGERFGQLTQLCGALAEAQLPVNVAEDAIVERVMSAVDSEKSQRPLAGTQTEMIQPSLVTRSLDTWRWIMRSPVSRIAAAAVFVLAITGFAMLFQGGSGTAFAFDDFVAPILESKTVKFKITIELKGPPAQTLTGEMMVLDGVRMRQVTQLADKSKGVVIKDLSQGKSLHLVPALKTATILTSTSKRKDKTPEYDVSVFFRLFQLIAEHPDAVEHESLGEKEIDGRKVVGFHIGGQPHDLILWGDPETGLPVRVETTSGIEGSVKAMFSDFVFDADMDESLFSLEPPAGYTVVQRNVKTDVSPPEEKDLIEMLREYSNLFDGAFPDSLDFMTTATSFGKKAGLRMGAQKMWEDLASGKGKPTAEQMQKLEELMSKMTEGKLNKEQTKEIAEQIKEYIENQTQKTAEVRETQEVYEARQAQFNEVFGRVQGGLQFALRLPPSADAHYVGNGVSFGTADTPIFWYRPKDSTTYRVIYADLSVRDSDMPPNG